MSGWRTRVLPLLLWLLAQLGPGAWAAPAGAVAGTLSLPAGPAQPGVLAGEWGFAWHAFLDPGWVELPTRGIAPVPSSWNDLPADGKPHGEDGWGTYALRVDCPAGESLALEAMPQRTASRLFVNGTLVAAHGRPGTSAADTWAAVPTRVPITREFACPLRITLHVANYDHRAGGFVRPLSAGRADQLARVRESRIGRHSALVAAYLLTSVVALVFYLVRRRESTPLLYGLSCVAMAVYTDMIGERLLLRALPQQVSWFAYMRVEYLSWIASMALFLLTLRGLFPVEIHRRATQAVVGTLGAAAAAVLALPPAVYSHVAVPGQLVAVLVAGYLAAAMVRARKRAPIDVRILLAGMLAILVAFVADLALLDVPGPDRKFTPFGFALFLLSPAVVLGRRLSRALNAEERSRTLEENARLREDVERISRHDLKTPLHSILGVARLLGDGSRPAGEQQELVALLQRSALRMLEMVDLSLGLFRMETGTYAFRPQAVDLGQVARQVLQDLQSHAESHDVTLHLEPQAGERPLVRAEELLCYSIIANLVKNAIEAAGAGNVVTVTLRGGEPVALAVHNPGAVPAAIVARFFDKYVTAKKGGAGLGTYSACLMARTQKGDLALQTGEAQGTTVTLTLPRAGAGLAPAATIADAGDHPREAADAAAVAGELLLVDDDETTRLVTRRLLPSCLSITTAANGQAAVAAMTRRWPDYLVIDMEMPVQDGIATVRWVRAQEAAHGRPRCRIVMVSGNDDPSSLQRAREAGADAFLGKPVSGEALLAALRAGEGAAHAAPEVRATPAGKPAGVVQAALARSAGEGEVVVDPQWQDMYPGFLLAQRDAVEAMARALADGDREQLQLLAHRASGSLALMGLDWAAGESRGLQGEARHGSAEALAVRLDRLRQHLGRLRIVAG